MEERNREMEEELVSIAKVCVTTTLALAYCYFLISKLPPGKLRLISLVPVFYIFTQLPFIFASVQLRGISAFFLVWLTIFKLLLFSVSQGPLSNSDLSFPLFLALSSLPIRIELAPGQKGRRVEIQTSNKGTVETMPLLKSYYRDNEICAYLTYIRRTSTSRGLSDAHPSIVEGSIVS
ncbi:hypothetical protein ZOSMA_439G00020 [Zostera marina]|uniref:Uncharacterized protein n=1 Tax=Zostera marina TaxID=29655 RepID=A0A0K9P3Y7_ZOSMR|nr:hypothetical protein ZOSMA_439G00020 [Zostera marina]